MVGERNWFHHLKKNFQQMRHVGFLIIPSKFEISVNACNTTCMYFTVENVCQTLQLQAL